MKSISVKQFCEFCLEPDRGHALWKAIGLLRAGPWGAALGARKRVFIFSSEQLDRYVQHTAFPDCSFPADYPSWLFTASLSQEQVPCCFRAVTKVQRCHLATCLVSLWGTRAKYCGLHPDTEHRQVRRGRAVWSHMLITDTFTPTLRKMSSRSFLN